MLNEYQKNERKCRDSSYEANLSKEKKITETFIKWCKCNRYRYRINPTDSFKNCIGEDAYISKHGVSASVDIKGFHTGYENVPLTYERSLDNIHWTKIFNGKKITDYYCFICIETEEVYFISKDEILLNFDSYKKTTADAKNAGHWQKLLLIPIINLHYDLY